MKFNRTSSFRRQRAFTMIEIAIAVGVIGFAVVAIIGILPQGMNTQKDNREDTTIAQDAPYFLNAIRNGEMRTNNNIFAQYVESISVTTYSNGSTLFYPYVNPNLTNAGPGTYGYLTNDRAIVGLLSIPEFDARFPFPGETNQVTAIVHAMTGSAVQQGGANTVMDLRYQLTVENVPWNSISYDSIAYSNYPTFSQDWLTRLNRANEVQYLTNYLHEVRLKFAWPVLPNGSIGPNRQTYRCLVSSRLSFTNDGYLGTTLWFYEPGSYSSNIYASF
jgi:type II secretory pathway pseudopilin PulG